MQNIQNDGDREKGKTIRNSTNEDLSPSINARREKQTLIVEEGRESRNGPALIVEEGKED